VCVDRGRVALDPGALNIKEHIMHARSIARKIASVTLLSAVGTSVVVGTSEAAPPMAEGFDVEFVDGSCGPGLDAVTNLHVQFTDKLLPDGSVHHWIDLSGTLSNESAGRFVTLHATRRFTDSAAGDSSIFRGLQGQFAAPGVGVLLHNSGWSDGALDHGRWDAAPAYALPPEVCSYLFG
jgi:hypothetical protein